MASRGSPVGLPVLGRLALALAATASVIVGGSRANLTTAGGLAVFYARLPRGDLLDSDGFASLAEWLRATEPEDYPPGTDEGDPPAGDESSG